MTKIGIISDLHSNLEALGTVLDYLDSMGVDRTFVLGDLIGYGPDPVPVLSRLDELQEQGKLEALAGNHDENVIQVFEHSMGIDQAIKFTDGNPQAKLSWKYTVDQLRAGFDRKEFLAKTPEELKELERKSIVEKYANELAGWTPSVQITDNPNVDPAIAILKIIERLNKEKELLAGVNFGRRKSALKEAVDRVPTLVNDLEAIASSLGSGIEKTLRLATTKAGIAYVERCKQIDQAKIALSYLKRISTVHELRYGTIHGVHGSHLDPQ